MALPKPDYIQNFIDEKIKKRKKGEKLPLLNGDQMPEEKDFKSDRKDETSSRGRGLAAKNSPPCGTSESDDPNGGRSVVIEKETKKRHKSVASDADLDTDDSVELSRRKAGYTASGNPARKAKKPKDLKSSLKHVDEKNSSYGGTSAVDLDCKGVLASYGLKGDQSTKKMGSACSTESKRQLNTPGLGGAVKKAHKKLKKGNEAEESNGRYCHSEDYKEKEESSNSESGLIDHSRRNSMESEHCHDSSDERTEREQSKRKKAMKKLLVATILSFLFMVGEVVGGYLANSLAVMTDASHLLTDVSSFMISILALKMASRPISKKMTFGWHRAEVIGALISVVAIWIVTGVLVYLAIQRLVSKDYVVNGRNMLITAGLAVGFNIVMGLVLHEHGHLGGHSHGGHGHSHGHDHDHEAGSNVSGSDEDSGDTGNVNVRAAFIHVLGDLLQSLGVMIAAFIIYFKPEYKIADPICTFLFSILVLITTITILRDTVIIIMEGSPVNIEYNVVKDKLLEIEGVAAVHDLRIWSLTLNQTVMSAHLAINKYSDPNTILKRATRKLKALYNFHSLTIQVEYYSDDMSSCKKCQQT